MTPIHPENLSVLENSLSLAIGEDLSDKTVDAIASWIKASKKKRSNEPLFTVLAYHKNGNRLTGEAIRRLVDGLCKQAGITKKMSPHRVRHSSITTVLDLNNGNYRATPAIQQTRPSADSIEI